MPYGIETVTVIGAGTMGAAIAGHLANAGLSVNLLDVIPDELTPEEAAAGLSLENDEVRDRVVRAGFKRMVSAQPAILVVPSAADRIQLGNLEDDFERMVARAEWVLEAIVEQPGPKQALMARIEACAKPDAIISSNTSGIPIALIAEGRTSGFARRFLGTHFFNPPRYLHLLELIPTAHTDPDVVQRMAQFCERTLGKGVVVCKDTPNFIANRMLAFVQSDLLGFAACNGYTVEEVDALTGPLLGRPRSATFRLIDVVGVDIMALVIENLYPRVPEDEDRELLRSPSATAILRTLVGHGHLGAKSGQGFYKTVVDVEGGKSFWGLDLRAAARGELAYLPPAKPHWESVGAERGLPLRQRLRALVEAEDGAGRLVWHSIGHTLAYASKRIPEIADSVADIDNAVKWGFAWEMGPFEIWDALGVGPTVDRLQREGIRVAAWVEEMLASGASSFYALRDGKRAVYSPLRRQYDVIDDAGPIRMETLRAGGRALEENGSASLFDLGDDVLLVEFHSKMNTFDEDTFRMLRAALARLHDGAAGLVIGNQGPTFSAGLNLAAVMQAVQAGDYAYVERIVREGQDVLLALREAPRPVVVALFQRALGGGLEIALAADRVVAHTETYAGLVETGVGIVPGWGGCKEMVRRHVSPHMRLNNANPSPHLRRVFETIGFARVSSSAQEAMEIGYLSPNDRIVMNSDHLLGEAKRTVLELAANGYRPPQTSRSVYAAGRDMLAAMRVEVHSLLRGGHISEYDAEIAGRLAYVLCGGELSAPAWMDEQYFLDLEREALLTLAGQDRTVERITYMLQNGRPLRN